MYCHREDQVVYIYAYLKGTILTIQQARKLLEYARHKAITGAPDIKDIQFFNYDYYN